MIEVSELSIAGRKALGVRIEMPGSPPLLLASGEKGVLFCGYLSTDAAEKFNLAAAVVRGVGSLSELMDKQISYYTKEAEKLGVTTGMLGRDALALFL